MSEKKTENRIGYKQGTKSVCIRLTPEQIQYLKEVSSVLGKNAVSAYIRFLIERDQRITNYEKEQKHD